MLRIAGQPRPCGKYVPLGSPPAGARRAPCERPPARCLRKERRLTDHASLASVDAVFHSRHRTAASRTNGQAERLRFLFVLFFAERKEHVSPLSKEMICRFLTDEKTTKRVAETPVSDSQSSAEKCISTARRCCSARELAQATTRRAGSNCCWEVCARRRKARAV